MNINCVICSDLFISADSIFTTPCGHIFHHVCLMQWMERSKSCPQCRNKCTEKNIFRIYFNNMANLDSTQNTANLVDSVDNLTLQVREKDQALKEAKDQRLKLEETLLAKQKKIEKLDVSCSRNIQIIATMRHEMDILSSHRASFKAVEAENAELKSKLDLMLSIESVLTASQSEIDEIMKQKLTAKDLSVMVGTLRRELTNNEARKHELKKQLQMIKNDLRAEQDERRKLQERLNFYESENHEMKNRLKRLENKIESCDVIESNDVDSPEPSKRPRLALKYLNDINTPSPLTQDELNHGVEQVKASDSPYLKVRSSSIALTSLLKRPMQIRDAYSSQNSTAAKSKKNDGLSGLSIFKKPRALMSGAISTLNSESIVYNGIGGTTRVLQSDLKKTDSIKSSLWSSSSKPLNSKKKKLSPSALGK